MMGRSAQERSAWLFGGLWALCCLFAVEALCFAPSLGRVGFYLDDWTMLNFLHFGPADWFSKTWYYLCHESRIVIRPIEAPYFSTLFAFFKLLPLGYHLVNALWEVLSAWLLFLVIRRVWSSQVVALSTAVLFLLYPAHDSTHYWVMAQSATYSMLLYMLSLYLTCVGAESGRRGPLYVAAGAFFLSIYNYEVFLPLFLVNALFAGVIALRSRRSADRAVNLALKVAGAGCVVVLSLVLFQKFISPLLGPPWIYAAKIDPMHILYTMSQGFWVSSPPSVALFAADLLSREAMTWVTPQLIFSCVGCVVLILMAGFAVTGRAEKEMGLGGSAWLVVTGIFVSFVSYSVFGLNKEYEPTLITIFNRINYGGSLGMAMAIAGVFGIIAELSNRARSGRMSVWGLVSGLTAALAVFFVVINWDMSRPWQASWLVQQRVIATIKENAPNLQGKNESLILMNCPRYAMWSPVFDGVWDFQNCARIMTGNQELRGGVVSDRLQVSHKGLKDVSHGFVCGEYSFDDLQVLVPSDTKLTPVVSADHFVAVVAKNGMDFGLPKEKVEEWQHELDKTRPAVRPAPAPATAGGKQPAATSGRSGLASPAQRSKTQSASRSSTRL